MFDCGVQGGTGLPVASHLHGVPGAVVTCAVTVTLGADGTLRLFSSVADEIVMDVVGWYAPAGTADPNGFASGFSYVPLAAPVRMFDTRAGVPAILNKGSMFSPGETCAVCFVLVLVLVFFIFKMLKQLIMIVLDVPMLVINCIRERYPYT